MWKFQELLNQNIAICLVMAAGAASVLRAVLQSGDTRVLNIFLFKFLLPASVVMGLGIKTDVFGEWVENG